MARQKTTAAKAPAKKRSTAKKAPAKPKTTRTRKGTAAARKEPQLAIQRVFLKKLVFDTPATPKVSLRETKPAIGMHMRSHDAMLEENLHEISLTIELSARIDKLTIYVINLQIAGIFNVENFNKAQLDHLIRVICPGMLYPYVREIVSETVHHGGFPELYLAPLNFEKLPYTIQPHRAT